MNDGAVVALVGHCGPDAWALKAAVSAAVPGARVVMVNDEAGLRDAVANARLLLVNRVLDGSFPTESGVELIRILAAAEGTPALMLVSNYADAQAEAVAAGARPGFGKTALRSDATAGMLREAVAG
jgi:hypothetical protein